MSASTYDLIIVGGGLVGAGLALALRDANLRVALIDARKPSAEDPRLFALNASSCQFLKNLKVWSVLEEHAAAIQQVHVSQQGRFGAVRLNASDANISELGHVIPARYIEHALQLAMQETQNLEIFQPATLQTLTQDGQQATLTISTAQSEKIITAPIVIGADGTESTVRKQLNIATTTTDYQQSALVTRTKLQRSHQHIAYERFTDTGAIAMLPLPNNECATIWTDQTDTINVLMNLSDDDFLQRLQKNFGYRVGRLQAITKRHVFPLRMVRAETMVIQNTFLLGNSAHTLHPIAAQGFNLALYEVAILAEHILQKRNDNLTFTAQDLANINQAITQQQSLSIGLSDKLTTLFTNPSTLASVGISLGMLGLDIATPLKKQFIAKMLGRKGKVPRLLLSAE